MERWVSGCPLRDWRKWPSVHFNRNSGHGALLVQVSAALPKIVCVVAAARTLSTCTDAAAAAPSASAARAYEFVAPCQDSTSVVDAAAVATRGRQTLHLRLPTMDERYPLVVGSRTPKKSQLRSGMSCHDLAV